VWLLDDQTLQLRQRLHMPAQLEIRLDLLLGRVESQLPEPVRLAARERVVGEVHQWLTAKKRERLTKLLSPQQRPVQVRLCRQTLKVAHVDLVLRAEPQQIPWRACLDPIGSEPLAQRRDVPVQCGLRSLRWMLTPESVHQLIATHNLVGAQQQQPQRGQLLRPNRRQIDPIGHDLEPAQHPELHGAPILAPIPC